MKKNTKGVGKVEDIPFISFRAEIEKEIEQIAREFRVTYEQPPFYEPKVNEDETKFGRNVIRFVKKALFAPKNQKRILTHEKEH